MSRPNGRLNTFLQSVDKGRLRLAGFNLVGCLSITGLLVAHMIRNEPYPVAVGIALALLLGGALTFATVWVSLSFGRRPPRSIASSDDGGAS